MINDPRRLVNDQIKKKVLEGLKPIATSDNGRYTNGDIKDSAQLFSSNVSKMFILMFFISA